MVTGGNELVTNGNREKAFNKLYNICIMEFISNMTRAQKEQDVRELYKQDKTSREIAERAHMSPCDIADIIRKVKAEVEREAGHTDEEEIDNKAKSKESQAFKLFLEGKTPVQVVIALDIPPDEYTQYIESIGNSMV